MKGVPNGYPHHWIYALDYYEQKEKRGIWKVQYTGTKTRHQNHTTEYYGTFHPDTRIEWWHEGTQTAIKLNKNLYNLTYKGTKRLLEHRIITKGQTKL